ncbi:MAG: flagellar assembly protein FliW [Candidatus Calescibacterium sp.]|nr:flagellar assembly protein FliW [Candidatus Calescibacterium sp.]MCX7734601.1 flagellar assembly protein FliW [bacterium]MDW8086608.1 flagellar assembly protein FliW [Candidatus Calescibacterium sp.]
MIEFESKIFGKLQIDENETFDFPGGVLGFPENRKFFFLKIINNEFPFPIEIMHSFDSNNLAFLVTDPSHILPTYSVLASPKELEEIKIKDISDVAIRVILHIEKKGKMTCNLIAPIILNTRDKLGKHLVLEGPDELLDVEIDLQKENQQKNSIQAQQENK